MGRYKKEPGHSSSHHEGLTQNKEITKGRAAQQPGCLVWAKQEGEKVGVFANQLDGWPKDIHGTGLHDGDIVAECKIGDVIWDGEAEIVSRPIGIFRVRQSKAIHYDEIPDRNDFYDIQPIRKGRVLIKSDKLKSTFNNGKSDYSDLYLTTYDGMFYGWDNIEIIGNIYNDFL